MDRQIEQSEQFANPSIIAFQAIIPFFVVGGTVQRDARCYVQRQADQDLYDGLRQGKFCYVLTSRQIGKSSLMVHAAARMREEGVVVVVLDLTAIGQNLRPEQWYDGLLTQIAQQLDLNNELEEFWAAHAGLGPLQRWMEAIRHVVLPRCPGRVVIFVDEIDAVCSLPFSTDEFFAGIREFYNRRTEDAELESLTFCLLGVASPSDLIRDTRTTPFNIGQRIELTDFTEREAAPLIQGLGRDAKAGQALLKRVLYWTGGHPYLTQRLCQAVAENLDVNDAQGVDRLCEELFLSHRAQERDDNLLFVRERLLRSEADLASLLDLYRQVRSGKRVADEVVNPLISVLRLSGITRVEGSYLRVRNRIYERVFDRAWVKVNMPDAELQRQRAAYRRGVWRTSFIAAMVLISVAGLAFTAIQQRNRAQDEARRADLNLQQANLNAAEARAASAEANRQRQSAEEQKAEADRQREAAIQQQLRAEQQEQAKSRLLYTARMNLAGQDWETGNMGRMAEYLNTYLPQPGQPDWRGFEWYYLWRLGHSSLMTLPHGSIVLDIAFSPDGKKLATAGRLGLLKLWDVATGQNLVIFNRLVGDVRAVAFSPDGKKLASAHTDQTLRLWDTTTGQMLSVIRGHTSMVYAVAFSPDGRLIASGARDRTAKLWEAATGRELFTLREQQLDTSGSGLAFSPDGKQLATASARNVIKLWNVATGQELRTFTGHTANVKSVAFSPDGKKLASGSSDFTIRLWDVARGQELLTLRGHSHETRATFSPDGQKLVSASSDGTSKLWDARTGQELLTLKEHTSQVLSVAYSPDGQKIATGSQDHTVKLWSAATEPEKVMLKEYATNFTQAPLRFLPAGKLAVGSADGGIRLRDLTTGSERITFKEPGHVVWPLRFSPDGRRAVIADFDNGSSVKVKIADFATGREVNVLTGGAAFASADVSQDMKLLASGFGDGAVRVWEMGSGKEVLTLKAHPQLITALAFSLDGKWLASANADIAKLWEVSTGRELIQVRGHTQRINALAFSPDGRSLASASSDRTVKLWDTATGREIITFSGHTNQVWATAFSPDGQKLATGSADQTIKLWDIRTGQELLTLKGHTSDVSQVAFSPDGCWLASAARDRKVILWRAATEREVTADLERMKNQPTSQLPPITAALSEDIRTAAFSPDRSRLVTGDNAGTLKLWETATGRVLARVQGHKENLNGVAFSPDGKKIATGGSDWTIKLWDVATWRELATLRGHAGPARAVAFSPDGKRLATGSNDTEVKLWDVATGRELHTLRGHGGNVVALAFSPDGRTLISGAADPMIKLWDVTTGQELATLTGHGTGVRALDFSPGGKLIASGSLQSVKLWDAATKKEVATFLGHTGVVLSVAFSPDGKKLATGGNDRMIKLWDVATEQELLTLKELNGQVHSIAFSLDGKTLAAIDSDQTIKRWDVATGKLLTTAW